MRKSLLRLGASLQVNDHPLGSLPGTTSKPGGTVAIVTAAEKGHLGSLRPSPRTPRDTTLPCSHAARSWVILQSCGEFLSLLDEVL
jgi:hypothetical protein